MGPSIAWKYFHTGVLVVVEHTTLAKVIEWRGDDENGQTVLEDVFREVIVLAENIFQNCLAILIIPSPLNDFC
jgi:hypothetical protein